MDGFKLPSIPPHTLQPEVKREELKPDEIVRDWLSKLSHRIANDSFDNLSELFHPDCWWRDILGMEWDFASKNGLENTRSYLATATNRIYDIQAIETGGLKAGVMELPGMVWIQGGFYFKNNHGSGRGIVKLLNTEGTVWKAWTVFTGLERLNFQEGSKAQKSLHGAQLAEQPSTADLGIEHAAARDDLQVLIVGAGKHSWVSTDGLV